MAINPDFSDLFSALFDEGAEFIVVGAHAVMFFTEPRYTKDLDVWVAPSKANAERVHRALARFGAPRTELTTEDLAVPGTIFQIGMAPNRIDVLTSIRRRVRAGVRACVDQHVRRHHDSTAVRRGSRDEQARRRAKARRARRREAARRPRRSCTPALIVAIGRRSETLRAVRAQPMERPHAASVLP
jgi:hypothetical protein